MGKSYLFPYEKVDAHSKILIYACGKVGMCYADQLLTNRYCEVAAMIDRNYKQKTCRYFPVYGLDYLRGNMEYDYLVIALQDEPTRNSVFQQLVELGVDEKKIVNTAPREIIDKCPETLRPDLSNLRDIVRGVELNADFRFEYYIDVINDIMAIQEDAPYLLEALKTRLADCEVPEERIVLLQLFYAAGAFDSELLRLYLRTVMELEDLEWKYIFFRVSSHIVFFNPEYLYDDFYLDRRRMMKVISDELGLCVSGGGFRRNTDGGKKRVAILALCLIDNQVGAHLTTIAYANLMQSHGYEVAVFSDEKSTDLLYVTCPCGKKVLLPTFYTVHAALYNSRHERNYHPDVQLVYTDSVSRCVCVQRTAKALEAFQPDCIIDISDDLSVLSAAFYEHYPIFHIPIRGYASSCFFDKFLARDKAVCLRENQRYHAVLENQMYDSFGLLPVPDSKAEYHRTDYDLRKSDFILVTVGNRLATEVTKDFTDSIGAMLKEHPNMRWILVGEGTPDYIDTEYESLVSNEQILKWGYEDDLPALYNICDVYVNPRRMGGGASIYWAMYQGIPLAMLSAPSDILPVVGVENTVGDTYEQMIEYILNLFDDAIFYQKEKSKFQKRAEYLSKRQAEIVQELIDTTKSFQ